MAGSSLVNTSWRPSGAAGTPSSSGPPSPVPRGRASTGRIRDRVLALRAGAAPRSQPVKARARGSGRTGRPRPVTTPGSTCSCRPWPSSAGRRTATSIGSASVGAGTEQQGSSLLPSAGRRSPRQPGDQPAHGPARPFRRGPDRPPHRLARSARPDGLPHPEVTTADPPQTASRLERTAVTGRRSQGPAGAPLLRQGAAGSTASIVAQPRGGAMLRPAGPRVAQWSADDNADRSERRERLRAGGRWHLDQVDAPHVPGNSPR